MANIRNNMISPAAARSGETVQEVRDRWAGEVTPIGMDTQWNGSRAPAAAWNEAPQQMGQMNDRMSSMNELGQMQPMDSMNRPAGLEMSQSGQTPQRGPLDMQSNLPDEVIESPTTVNEAYLGSLKAMLMRNKGNYIVATFLVGTQNTVSWEGVLYDVGNDYVTIYQPGRDRYIVSDMYSLKYMEFYDVRRRELCDRLLGQNGMQNSW